MSENEGMRTVAVVFSRLPVLGIRFLFTFMRFKRRVKKSAKRLRKSMIKGGMSKKDAAILTARYEESVSLRKIMKNAGVDLPFSFGR